MRRRMLKILLDLRIAFMLIKRKQRVSPELPVAGDQHLRSDGVIGQNAEAAVSKGEAGFALPYGAEDPVAAEHIGLVVPAGAAAVAQADQSSKVTVVGVIECEVQAREQMAPRRLAIQPYRELL